MAPQNDTNFGTGRLVVLVGASGSGKTTIARAIASCCSDAAMVFHFDSIGIPPVQEMIMEHGTCEAWQRAKTIEWMLKLAREKRAGLPVLFEGQTRFSFLADAAVVAGGLAYDPMLVDCDDDVRSYRLSHERKQPELDTEDMKNWARYLRRQARERGCPILDTSGLSLDQSVEHVMARLNLR
jgi:energy-coupling factor transporter ATP-binding protein EcfA2